MLISRVILCSLLGLIANLGIAQRSFLVAPTHVNIDLTHRKIQTFIVSNTGDDRVHIKIKPIFMPVASRSLQLGKALFPQKEKSYDLSSYIIVSPRALSLSPGEEREVRMSISPPHNLPSGAYRSHLLFHMIHANKRPIAATGSGSKKTIKFNLNMMMEMAISIYGTKGSGDAKLAFQCRRLKDGNLNIAATNASPWRFEGTLNVSPLAQHKTDVPVDLVLLRDSKRELQTKIHASAKQYILHWKADPPYQGAGKTVCNLS
ncbi:MAG: hypothetical protein P1U40_07275 [Coxiellaceae bacterium]|nr:hypothetical protein [Coxiellaceae bacterium]